MRPDEVERIVRCTECGSGRMDIDKNFLRYCRDCGTVLEELVIA